MTARGGHPLWACGAAALAWTAMGEVMVDALRPGDPVLVVTTDAGDAARGNEFWRTREVAALASMRAAQELAALPASTPRCTTERIPGRARPLPRPGATHAVRHCRTGSMSTVFLRLPDGKPDGTGYAVHAYRSLRKLADSTIGHLDAIDSSARYTGLDDLATTVAGIVRRHQRLGLTVHVHTSDPELLTNPIAARPRDAVQRLFERATGRQPPSGGGGVEGVLLRGIRPGDDDLARLVERVCRERVGTCAVPVAHLRTRVRDHRAAAAHAAVAGGAPTIAPPLSSAA